MKSLVLRMVVATAPLIILVVSVTLAEMISNHHGRRILKKLASGALHGLWHGPMFR